MGLKKYIFSKKGGSNWGLSLVFSAKGGSILGLLCFFSLALSACLLPEKKSQTTPLPDEKPIQIEGEIFPFSVPVATRATHRLEKDGRLASYLASEVMELSDFEGQNVFLEGFSRTEKMREILWVEKIRLLEPDQNLITELDYSRFSTKNFSFTFPKTWEYSTDPFGGVHFLEKNDDARRVFLMFSAEPLGKKESPPEPNISVNSLDGVRQDSTDALKRSHQKITLFSKISDRKYTFQFTAAFEDFEKTKSFSKLLQSFVEGEEAVKTALQSDQKKLAELEKQKISSPPPREVLTQNPAPASEKVNENLPKNPAPASGEFKNLIDQNAFFYESAAYRFSLQVPFGFWFKNFGSAENRIAVLGFSDQNFESIESAKFLLEIIGDENPPTSFAETVSGENGEWIEINFPRTQKSFFRFSGPSKFRDAMRSIHSSVKTF